MLDTMFRFTTLTISALAATFVAAQDTTSETCITDCANTAAVSAGCSFTDLTCICTKLAFQTAAAMCIQQMCPDQLASAQVAFQQNCSTLSIYNDDPYGTPAPASSGSTGSSSHSGAAFKRAPVAGAMGVLAAFVGAAIF